MRRAVLVPMGEYGCCLAGPITLILALCLTGLSLTYQRPVRTPCGGQLGAGFPVAFICDGGGGSSPRIGIGTLGSEDVERLDVIALVTDVLAYALLIWGAWVIAYNLWVWADEHGWIHTP